MTWSGRPCRALAGGATPRVEWGRPPHAFLRTDRSGIMLRIASLALMLVAVCSLSVAGADDKKDKPKEKDSVEVTGKLNHPVFAIGGETTGTVVETKKGAYELDL